MPQVAQVAQPRAVQAAPLAADGTASSGGRVHQLQLEQQQQALLDTASWLPPATLAALLACAVAEWSVVVYSRSALGLDQALLALRAALHPLRWQGACLPLLPRARSSSGVAALQRLRARLALAEGHAPGVLLGVLRPHLKSSDRPARPTF